ncbi:MAG: ABC transporter permease subunit [Spirochaetia bacterium]|nr:ABC transporter permease subunit [Spirochaetia bacterium]
MFKFPEILSIPMAKWVDSIMQAVLDNFGGFFDLIGHISLIMLMSVERVFLAIPWFVIVIAVGILGWKILASVWKGVLFSILLMIIGSFGYWDLAMMTLAIVITSVITALIIGIPIGIIMAWSRTVETIIRPILDAMQTLPSFVYLIPALMLFGLGKVPAAFATFIYAVPPVIRLTCVGIRGVPEDVVEAAKAFGSSRWQILFDVQLPLARPSIMVGINQTTMMALAMVVVGSMIGAKGLGMEVLLSINRIEVGRGFEAGLSIVLLAIVIDRLTNALSKNGENTAGNGT